MHAGASKRCDDVPAKKSANPDLVKSFFERENGGEQADCR